MPYTPIALPVTRTIIATAPWGIPITNAVNQLGTDVTALQGTTTPTAWTAPTLLNGWVSYGAGFIAPGYRKVGDMVQIRGAVKSGTMGVSAFNLPVGFRPPAAFDAQVYSDNGSAIQVCSLTITAAGDVLIQWGGNARVGLGCQFSITP